MATRSHPKCSSEMSSKPSKTTPSKCVRLLLNWISLHLFSLILTERLFVLFFQTSEYPVILSLENHCSLDQQKLMAHYLISILGDALVSKPLGNTMPSNFPSPEVCCLQLQLMSCKSLPEKPKEKHTKLISHFTFLFYLTVLVRKTHLSCFHIVKTGPVSNLCSSLFYYHNLPQQVFYRAVVLTL